MTALQSKKKSEIRNPQSEIAMGAGQKFVPNGVMLMCNGGVAPGRLNVIPKNVMLDGQIFATELDTMPFVNIPSFGACQRLRYCPPCMPAPTGWKNVCDDGVKVMGARPLLEKSTNSCAIGGKITIMFVPPGGFSGSFTGITPSGLPDMSALTGGDGLSSLASNPAAAISNVGGVASLANVGSGGLTSITNLSSNVLSSAAGGVNALRQAASGQASGMLNNLISGVAGGLSGITSGFGQMVSGFGQAASAIQSTMQQGNVFLDRINGYVGSVSQFGGTIARWTGNTRLQDAMMRLANQIGNAKNKLNNTINQIGTYKDALSGANGYFGKATDFLNNFKKSMENGELGKQWTAFIAKLGTKAQSFFDHFKRGISDLKNVKYPDTIAAWLETSKGGLERLTGHAHNLSISFTNAKSYLSKSSERIKTFGGVGSTLTGNPNAQAAASKWAAQWDNAANKMGNYATKATVLSGDFKNGAEFAQTGAEWAKKASDFLSKDAKTGDLKQQWDAFTERLGTQASAFFDKIKTNAANLQNIPYPDTAAGWLAAGGEGFTRLSGNLNKATNGLNDLKGDLAKGAAQIRSFGGTLSRVTGNKKLEEWAANWDNATNKVGNAINQVNKYGADAKSYGDKLKSGSQYVQKLSDFFKKYEAKTPVGNPFQNWGTSVSNWISDLKKLPIEAPRAGSVKELLGDITKISDKIGANRTGLGDYLGKSVQRANEFAGVLSLLDKDAAAKVQKLAAETAALQQKAAEIKAKAAAVKAKIEKAKQDLDKAKAALQKASALWDKMKEKLPDFSKGADLFQQYLPKLPEIASIAAVIKAFPAIDSIANASQAANIPIANAFSASITNSFANVSSNNVFTNNTTSSITQISAVKAGSASVSASGGGGMGVVNGSSRIGTVTVQKVSVSLPDMSDKNAPKNKSVTETSKKSSLPIKPTMTVNPYIIRANYKPTQTVVDPNEQKYKYEYRIYSNGSIDKEPNSGNVLKQARYWYEGKVVKILGLKEVTKRSQGKKVVFNEKKQKYVQGEKIIECDLDEVITGPYNGAQRTVFYKKEKSIIELVNINSLSPNFSIINSNRIYANPDIVAAIIGVTQSVSIISTGSTTEDATGFPSLEHVNGESIDTASQISILYKGIRDLRIKVSKVKPIEEKVKAKEKEAKPNAKKIEELKEQLKALVKKYGATEINENSIETLDEEIRKSGKLKKAIEKDQILIDAMQKFGFQKLLRGQSSEFDELNRGDGAVDHDNHFHFGKLVEAKSSNNKKWV